MSKPNISLTKTCSSCGQQKPLSAFLQIAGDQGAIYGNICSSCRKTPIEKAPEEPEESTTSRTGVKIDSKTKVQGEIDKRELRKQIEEEYFKDRDLKDEKQVLKTQKIESTVKDEKKRLQSFLEKRSVLEQSKKPQTPSQVFGGEDHKAQAGKLDFASGPVEYTRVAGQIKMHSPIFNAFKTWLGNAAPIVGAAERAANQRNKNPNKKPGAPAADPVNEYVNKNRKK